jgi:hypothetical protein
MCRAAALTICSETGISIPDVKVLECYGDKIDVLFHVMLINFDINKLLLSHCGIKYGLVIQTFILTICMKEIQRV